MRFLICKPLFFTKIIYFPHGAIPNDDILVSLSKKEYDGDKKNGNEVA